MSEMEIARFTFNPIAVNTYVIESAGECVVVDPGCINDMERGMLAKHIEERQLKVVGIWLTHLHFDHVWSVSKLQKKWGVEVYASEQDEFLIEGNEQFTIEWSLPGVEKFRIGRAIEDGEELTVGGTKWRVISTPGHTPGGVTFYNSEEKVCLTGDTLFCGGVGRTDFPMGDSAALADSVRNRLLTLAEDIRVLPGHGPETTIGKERLMVGCWFPE
ncbi:MAG: MBL fold metallo-hydrolase [Bacteroidales bacterium]|jgi:glyoxylase-like metal-dependent hydrolase (beta-lactamase superfamily II)|nr:MBL fold metallo-hydrolase [Bacteroidales bacterium]